MAYSKSQRKATEKWEAQNYEQIRFTVPKGFKARLQESVKKKSKKFRKKQLKRIKRGVVQVLHV